LGVRTKQPKVQGEPQLLLVESTSAFRVNTDRGSVTALSFNQRNAHYEFFNGKCLINFRNCVKEISDGTSSSDCEVDCYVIITKLLLLLSQSGKCLVQISGETSVILSFFFRCFLQSLQENARILPLGHDRFLPNPC
jgi:hypothetical protein